MRFVMIVFVNWIIYSDLVINFNYWDVCFIVFGFVNSKIKIFERKILFVIVVLDWFYDEWF